MHPHICDYKREARALGIQADKVERRDLKPILIPSALSSPPTAGRVIYLPFMEYVWNPEHGDSDHVTLAKEFATGAEGKYIRFARYAAGQIAGIDKNEDLSAEGKSKLRADIYEGFLNREGASGLPAAVRRNYLNLLSELFTAQSVPALNPGDSAAAVGDAEYRGLLRDKSPSDRLSFLHSHMQTAVNNRFLLAALRAEPEASGLDLDHWKQLRAQWAVKNRPAKVAAVWRAAAGLEFVTQLLSILDSTLAQWAGKNSRLSFVSEDKTATEDEIFLLIDAVNVNK